MNKHQQDDAELDALRQRSAELIAEVNRINERIEALMGEKHVAEDEISRRSITETWVDR